MRGSWLLYRSWRCGRLFSSSTQPPGRLLTRLEAGCQRLWPPSDSIISILWSNLGFIVLKNTSTRVGIEPPTPWLKDVLTDHWPLTRLFSSSTQPPGRLLTRLEVGCQRLWVHNKSSSLRPPPPRGLTWARVLFPCVGGRVRGGGGGHPLVWAHAVLAQRRIGLPGLLVRQVQRGALLGRLQWPPWPDRGVDPQPGLGLVLYDLPVVGPRHPALVQAFVGLADPRDLQLVRDVVALDLHRLREGLRDHRVTTVMRHDAWWLHYHNIENTSRNHFY